MANEGELWKGFGMIFLAGAAFSWSVYGIVLGLLYLAHHIAWK